MLLSACAAAVLQMAGCLLQVYGGLTSGLYRFNVWVAGQSQQQAAMGTTYAVTSVSADCCLPLIIRAA